MIAAGELVQSKGARLKGAPLRLVPGQVVTEAVIRGFRWGFDDDIAADLDAGVVLKLDMALRFADVRRFNDGDRWVAEVLGIGRLRE